MIVRFSLFPSRPLAFGVDIRGALQDTGDNPLFYGLFLSWFPQESIELQARYTQVTIDEPQNVDSDGYMLGIGVNFRF